MDLTAGDSGFEDGFTKRQIALRVLITTAVLHLGRKLFRSRRASQQYDGLDGVVSFSSRIIAAFRCLESEEPHPLFSDPLARTLAGRRAIERAERRSQDTVIPESERESGALCRMRKIGRITIRTLWFDRQLLAALSIDQHPQQFLVKLSAGSSGVKLGMQPNPVPKQVVLLGAGMDTRAWRLPLPEGVEWFEIDRMDVLSAKLKAMAAAGACMGSGEHLEVLVTASEQPGKQSSYPLQASSYAAVEADLSHRGFTAALAAKGWDRTAPTVWLAEGLLMYLQPDAALTMLKETAEASAPGSVLLALSVTEAVIENVRALRSQSELLNYFVFGCPPDPRQMLREVGWNLLTCETRQDMVNASHMPSRLFANFSTPSKDHNSMSIVAAPN